MPQSGQLFSRRTKYEGVGLNLVRWLGMLTDSWTSLGLLGMYGLRTTCCIMQMRFFTCATVLAQRPGGNGFKFCQGSFRGLYLYSDGGCSILWNPVVAEADFQCREADGHPSDKLSSGKKFKLGF